MMSDDNNAVTTMVVVTWYLVITISVSPEQFWSKHRSAISSYYTLHNQLNKKPEQW